MAMIEAAEREGRIEPGRTTIVEATSGNTGSPWRSSAPPRATTSILTLPAGDEPGARRAAEALRGEGGGDRVARRYDGSRGGGAHAWPGATTSSCRINSPIRRILKLICERPGRSCGMRWTGASTCSWPAWGPAARSRVPARCSRPKSELPDRRRRAKQLARPVRGSARAPQDPGHRRRVRPSRAQLRDPGRDHPVDDEDAIETARLLARREGSAERASRAALRRGRRCRSPLGLSPRGAHRDSAAGLRRAIRLDAVLRAVSIPAREPGGRAMVAAR